MVEKLDCINKKTHSVSLFTNQRLIFEIAPGPEKMPAQQVRQPQAKESKLVGEINVSKTSPTKEYREGQEKTAENTKQAWLKFIRENGFPEPPEKRIA